jgi:hypothetical protein
MTVSTPPVHNCTEGIELVEIQMTAMANDRYNKIIFIPHTFDIL